MVDFAQIKNHILQRLKYSLPTYLIYHNVNHTLDVLKQAVVIAGEEGINSLEDMFLIKVAALYHDTGFIYLYKGHEEKSCEIAMEELASFGVDEKIVKCICGMIRATRIPQSPKTVLEQIICDADLDYLGRQDFYEIGEGLFKEFFHQKIVKNELEWNLVQVRFLENHTYFTKSSKLKREALKQQHLNEIRRKVQSGA
ncbi:MAG: HD domain-containing protein [Chitinophagaceae bacterium]